MGQVGGKFVVVVVEIKAEEIVAVRVVNRVP